METVSYEPKGDVFWSYVFSFVYVFLFGAAIYHMALQQVNYAAVTLIELIILALATFRLIRLFTYDKIMQFFRDWFTDVTREWDKKKEMYKVTREKPHHGFQRKVYELLGCPWCVGMWIAPAVLFTYYFVSFSIIIFAAFAIAGVATFIQITMNGIGWNAEYRKLKVHDKEK